MHTSQSYICKGPKIASKTGYAKEHQQLPCPLTYFKFPPADQLIIPPVSLFASLGSYVKVFCPS